LTPSNDLAGILLIIPCSKAKCLGGSIEVAGRSILDELPPDLARRLSAARAALASVSRLDEAHLMPAWCRYTGRLYAAARDDLKAALGSGRLPHLLILSGGYGVVRATDPIGWYDRALSLRDWPSGLLGDVICHYAKLHGLSAVRAFAGSSTTYAKALRSAPWHSYGLTDVILKSPVGGSTGTTPPALGEAVAAMLGRSLSRSWRSSHGLAVHSQTL
jgi:hypothetical protein